VPGTLEDTITGVVALRSELVELLAGQPDHRWDEPCLPGWRVRDVATLVLLPPPSWFGRLRALARAGFDRGRAVRDDTVRRADVDVPALLAAFRHATAQPWLPRDRRAEDQLAETYVRALDVRAALGLPRTLDAALVDRVLTALVARPDAAARAAGLRLVAADTGWSHGQGLEVSGPADAVALALAGRRGALGELTGPGVATLVENLALRAG
jgi:uncharacterized protein (TIGR03083 family)